MQKSQQWRDQSSVHNSVEPWILTAAHEQCEQITASNLKDKWHSNDYSIIDMNKCFQSQ